MYRIRNANSVSVAEFLGNRFHGYSSAPPSQKYLEKPLSAMEVSKGRDADSRGGEKGGRRNRFDYRRGDGAEGRPGKEETTWFVKRRGKMGAAHGGAGETKRG